MTNDYRKIMYIYGITDVYTPPPTTLIAVRAPQCWRSRMCLWEVFVWGFGVLFLSCASVSVSGVLFSVGVCVGVTC